MPGSQYVTFQDAEVVVGSSPVGLTAPAGTVAALVTVGDVAIRFKTTGSNPTSSSGHKAPAGAAIEVYGGEVVGLRMISEGANSTCFVSFLRER